MSKARDTVYGGSREAFERRRRKEKEKWPATQQLSRVGGFQVRCQKQDQDTTRPDQTPPELWCLQVQVQVQVCVPAPAPGRGVCSASLTMEGPADPPWTRSQSVSSHAETQTRDPPSPAPQKTCDSVPKRLDWGLSHVDSLTRSLTRFLQTHSIAP